MEMVFCFCERCLKDLDSDFRLYGEIEIAVLHAYTGSICALCETKGKMAGTRKFEVELSHVEMKDGVHQYTEFALIRYIPEGDGQS